MNRLPIGAVRALGERLPPQKVDAPPRQLRLVVPRKPRGYWLEDGEGGQRFLAAVQKYGAVPSLVASKLGIRYGNAYLIGLRLGCWREGRTVKRNSVPQCEVVNRDVQEIDFSQCEMAKFYGYKGNTYASVPEHVSKAEGMK